jgi:hypothetical protein
MSRDWTFGRGQLSLSVIEAALGVAFVLAIAVSFGLTLPEPATEEVQLDAYASDTATVLTDESPRHVGESRLTEVTRSPAAFQRERDALRERVGRILGENLLFRIETPHGTVGYATPTGVVIGQATVPTRNGVVVIRVWYA